MIELTQGHFKGQQRGNWIRLRTMILLRWFAIFGQLSALFVGHYVFDLWLPITLCLLAVGLSVLANLTVSLIFPENKRLSETENLCMVVFDLIQLGLLLYLTGGLNNPFSILILVPVTISAAAFSLRSTLYVGAAAIVLVTTLAEFHLELKTQNGFILQIPDVFLFGAWISITVAIVFLATYSRWITTEMHSMSDALEATQLALEREQKLTDIGGVVAAAAHELGTPLATIKLASAELMDELVDHAELFDDARLIREQADRCRDILASMGSAGKDDLLLRQAPLTAIVEEAAQPHVDRGKLIHFEPLDAQTAIPSILRKPEIIHGLRNLVQNAVDFSRSNVWVASSWSDDTITIHVMDDGDGFPAHLIGRIGDPFILGLKSRRENAQRPEYEGMGLGLFIAKTLLERSGASVSFSNGPDGPDVDRTGASVIIRWPRSKIDAETDGLAIKFGENRLNTAKATS